MKNILPFQHLRYEYEQRHIYYLPSHLSSKLDAPKPAYLVGTRGTGKTTLLKSMEWKERLNNDSLKRQLGSDVFEMRFVGAYLKLPETLLQTLEKKLPESYPHAADQILSLYLDLITLQPLFTGLSELSALGTLQFSPKCENLCVGKILSLFPFLQQNFEGDKPTLRCLKVLFSKAQRELEKAVLYDATISPELLYSVSSIGEVGRRCSEILGELCNQNTTENPWHFKICLDEAESLGARGRRVLNTIVRTSKVPLIHIAAFVGVSTTKLNETCNPSLTLAEEDRSLIPLDEVTNVDFRAFVEGVATARIQESTSDSNIKVNLNTILGKLDMESLSLAMLKESVNPQAKMLLDEFENNPNDNILRLFLDREVNRKCPPDSITTWQKRRLDSSFLRKKKVAAYLGLCRSMKVFPRYSSSDMLIGISDHCIRDFLRFINQVFVESKSTIANFAIKRINDRIQDSAIKKASQMKIDSLAESGVHEPAEAQRVLDGLAKITAILQNKSADNSNYSSPERGVFHMKIDYSLGDDMVALTNIISDSAEAGFLIIKESGPSRWVFRVHSALAPHYGFSYRGAYYPTHIRATEIQKLASCKSQGETDSVVKLICHRFNEMDSSEGSLFDYNKK